MTAERMKKVDMQKLSVLIISSLGSLAFFLFGEWDYLLMALVALVAMDYLTGTIAAFINKRLSSKVGFKGIAKKIFIFAMIAVANFIDSVFWENGHIIRDGAILFYILNEMISITENARIVGVPIPEPLKKAIAILKDRFKS